MTIPACKICNDRFGHAIEGPVSRDLAPVIVILRTSGLVAPKLATWLRAYKDTETGIEYDLNSDLQARRSDPIVSRDEAGKMKEAFFHDEKMKRKFVAAAEKRGKKALVIDHPAETKSIPPLACKLTFGLELRRLAMKMAVALGNHVQSGNRLLDPTSRGFLLSESEEGTRTIRDVSVYHSLEEQRPPLSHLIYLEGNATNRHCYGVVQFYGLFQIYLTLNESSYDGSDFAALAILNPAMQYSETFKNVNSLRLTPPPIHRAYGSGVAGWSQRFGAQLSQVFGTDIAEVKVNEVTPALWTSTSSTMSQTTFLTKPPEATDRSE